MIHSSMLPTFHQQQLLRSNKLDEALRNIQRESYKSNRFALAGIDLTKAEQIYLSLYGYSVQVYQDDMTWVFW